LCDACRSVDIQQFLSELIQGRPTVKDVVAILQLGEEEPVLAARFFAFAVPEDRLTIFARSSRGR
jgi:hypothetical protein